MQRSIRTLLVALIFATAAPSVWACCMVPESFAGSIGQDAQQAVMFYKDGREDLILGIDYRITPNSDVEKVVMPDRFAWVITVPNEPDRYKLADRELFEEVNPWAYMMVAPPRPRSNSLGVDSQEAQPKAALAPDSIELGKREIIGPYDIQPVRGVGPDALTGLNDWLKDNGFPAEDPDHMKYFVEENFTFLAIKINKPKDGKAVGDAGQLPPLHLSFKTDAPYYPLRFSSRQGVFDVNLVVFSSEPLDYKKSLPSLDKMSWSRRNLRRNVPVKPNQFPEMLAESYGQVEGAGKDERWLLNVVSASQVNRGDTIAKWDSDVFLAVNADAPINVNPAKRASSPLTIGIPTAAGLAFLTAAIVLRRRRLAS